MRVEGFEAVARCDVCIAELRGAGEQRVVNFSQHVAGALDEFFLVGKFLGGNGLVAALHADLAGLDVAGADLDADRYALFDPIPLLYAAANIAGIDVNANRIAAESLAAQRFGQRLAGIEHCLAAVFLRRDWQNDDLLGRDARRQDQPVVVRVRHDQRADQAGGNTPRSRVRVLHRAVAAGERNVLRLREILPEVMRRSRLDRLAVLHHRLDR